MRASALVLVVAALASGQERYADEWLEQPVDDATFENYLEFFVVDHGEPLEPELVDTRERDGVRREEWSFTGTPGESAYGHYFTVAADSVGTRPAVLMCPGVAAKTLHTRKGTMSRSREADSMFSRST